MPVENLSDKVSFVKGDEKYRIIIDNMNLGLLEVDLEGVIQHANASFCKMVGYDSGELIGNSAAELLLSRGSLSEKLVEEHSSKRLKGQHSVYEIQVTRKDGLRIWVMIGGGPLHDQAGNVVGTIGIHLNVTDKKKNEEGLKRLVHQLAQKNEESERQQEFLKAINDFSNLIADKQTITEIAEIMTSSAMEKFGFEDCIIYVIDDEEGVLNQASAFGLKKDELGGVRNPIRIPLSQGIVGTVGKTGKAEIVNDTSKDPRYIVDDTVRLSEISVPIIYDKKVLGVIDSEHSQKNFFTQEHLDTLTTLASLASARLKSAIAWEKAEEIRVELVESESKFRNIIDTALDAVVMINGKGIVTEWNHQAKEIFGYSGEETIGKKLSKLIIPEQYQAAHEKGMKKFHKTGEGPVLDQRIEITAIGKNRDEFPIELSISPIKVNNQHFFSAFLRDISEQKANQEKIEKSLERERELNELKSKFVSMASHEFRTPLTTIKVNVDLLNHRLAGVENAEPIMKNLNRIDNEVERLKSLMNDVLTIGRIQAGKVDINLQKTNLVYLVTKIVEASTAGQSDGRKAAFTVYGKEKEVKIDPNVFGHIISNLISNAFKYSEGKDEPEVAISFKKEQVELMVRDHGIGIPKKDLENISDTFFRASNVGNIQGSGIGLAIVNQFVKLHNGTVDLASAENKGTTVTVSIPL